MKHKAGKGHNYDAVHPKKTKGKPTPADIYAGAVLRTFRLQRGLSQEGLAERAGITFQQIQKYEKGTNRISVGRLSELVKILEVSPADFFDIDDSSLPKPRGQKKSVLDLSKEQQKFLRIFDETSEEKQKELYKMVRDIKKLVS